MCRCGYVWTTLKISQKLYKLDSFTIGSSYLIRSVTCYRNHANLYEPDSWSGWRQINHLPHKVPGEEGRYIVAKNIGTLVVFSNNSQFSLKISWNWQKYFVSTIRYFTVTITEPLFLVKNLKYPFKSENKKKWQWQNYWHPWLNIW